MCSIDWVEKMRYAYKKKAYILLFSIIDLIGKAVFYPFRKSDKRPAEFKRILVIREDHIGDVITATAVLSPLRKRFPEARIDFMVPRWALDLVKSNSFVDNLIAFDPPWFDRSDKRPFKQLRGLGAMAGVIKEGGYDIGIDLRGDARHITAMFLAGLKERVSYGITGMGFLLTREVPYEGKMHETDRNIALLRPFGIKARAEEIRLAFPSSGSILSDSGVRGNYAVLHISPGHDTKKWKNEEFARIVKYLKNDKKLDVAAVGTKEDRQKIREVSEASGIELADISGKTALGELGSVISGADIFVGVDSGPSHIAAASGIPTVILFSGVNDPAQWAPKGKNVKIICPGARKDLSSVSAGEVIGVIEEVLK
jgi:ADP-heptose:LPS heptosyltransferase